MSKEKWDKQTVANCVYYICVHSNSQEFYDEVYKYQEQDRLSEIPTQIMNLYKQLQARKEENSKLHKEILDLKVKNSDLISQVTIKDVTIKVNGKTKIAVASRVKEILDIIDGKDNLTQQNKQMKETLEKIRQYAFDDSVHENSRDIYDMAHKALGGE